MNATVAQLTLRNLVGRRRKWLLLALPLILLILAVVLRATVAEDSLDDVTVGLLGGFAVGTLVPLLALIAGTGSIGPEIDDGSIVYLLSKPVNRHSITNTKFAVAVSVLITFGVVPVLLAGLILSGTADNLALAYGLAALVSGTAYCSLFLMLAVITRNAVVMGLIYALVWESLVGTFVPGAQALSIQQWSLALAKVVVGDRAAALNVTSAVSVAAAIPLLAVLIIGGVVFAGNRLRSLRLTGDD